MLESIGLPAEDVLLVDDAEEYVENARRCGMRATCWSFADGLDALTLR